MDQLNAMSSLWCMFTIGSQERHQLVKHPIEWPRCMWYIYGNRDHFCTWCVGSVVVWKQRFTSKRK